MILLSLLSIILLGFATADETIILRKDMPTVTIKCGEEKSGSWFYSGASGEVSSVSNTTSYNITASSNPGTYTCISNGTESAVYIVTILVEPKIENMRKSITYTEGDRNRKLKCVSAGSYPGVEFTWKRKALEEDGVGIVVSPDTNPNVQLNETYNSSTLLFYNLTYDVAGVYECHVENLAGNSSIELTVRVKDKYAALWPFLGICCEVFILIVIIFIYEKQSKKSSDKDNKLAVNDDEKPLNKAEEANGTEMRNRSASTNKE